MQDFFNITLYGFNIKSNISLPIEISCEEPCKNGDYKTILYENENPILENYSKYSQNSRNYITYKYNDKLNSYLIETERMGNAIINEHSIKYFDKSINMKNAFLLSYGMGLGMLLRLNGCIILHASTIRINGKTILIMGQSGVGKSTFCSNLIQNHNAKLISDDMTCINASTLCMFPGLPVMRLWPTTVKRIFNQDCSKFKTVGGKGKVFFPIKEWACDTTSSVDVIVILQLSDSVPSVTGISKKELICNVYKHIYNKPSLTSQALCREMNSILHVLEHNCTSGFIVNNIHSFDSLNNVSSLLLSKIFD